jgi:ankyrin repeat protein
MTALMQAVKRNDAATVHRLIAQGVNVDELDNGDPPIVQAAYLGYADVLKALLQAGADVRAVDPGMKATGLHAAAYAGHANTAKLLIDYGVEINRRGPYNGYTALHDATWQNNIDVAKLLIDSGADLTIQSNDGQTPLDFAKAKGRREIAAMIEKKLGN